MVVQDEEFSVLTAEKVRIERDDARKVALYEQGFDGEIYSGSLYWAQLRWREAAGRRLTGVLTGKLIVFEDGEWVLVDMNPRALSLLPE